MAQTIRVPTAVRLASLLLAAGATVSVAAFVAAALAVAHVADASAALLRNLGEASDYRWVLAEVRYDVRYDEVVGVITVLLLVAAAVAILRPIRWIRATTWTALVALLIAVAFGAVASPEGLLSAGPGDPAGIADALRSLLPGWYPDLHAVTASLSALAMIAAGVLLARTGVADFYHRPPPDARPSLYVALRDRDGTATT